MKHFELGKYKGLNVGSFDVAVKEDEIKEAINYFIKSMDEIEVEKWNEPIEPGDSVIVNIVGTENGIPYPKVKEDGLQFKVGDINVLQEFSARLLGQKMGDTVVFETTIQPVLIEFQALWGREITFSIEIIKVFNTQKPELTDENIQEIEPKVKTLQEFEELLEANILEEKRTRARVANMSKVLGAVAGNCKYEFEQEILDQAAEELYRNFAGELKKVYNTDLVVYLVQRDMSSDELLAECKEEAARRMVGEKILDAVIQAEGIRLTDEETVSEEKPSENRKDIQYMRRKAMDFLLEANLAQ